MGFFAICRNSKINVVHMLFFAQSSGLDRRKLALDREEGQIVDHGNRKEWVITFGNQEYAGFLLAPAQDSHHRYIL